jgi:uncharacterized protein (TIGR03435 family)
MLLTLFPGKRRSAMNRLFWLAALVFTPLVWAQSFEVASIRLHTTQIQTVGLKLSGPRFIAEALSADNLITYAYDVKDYQVSGIPAWADSTSISCDRYDVNAKGEGDEPLTADKARQMVQRLLAERFHLQFHRQMKDAPVYALVVIKGGHKLMEHSPEGQPVLRMKSLPGSGIELTSNGGTITQLVNQISNHNGVDRPVLDQTGLTGNYDYKLTWAAALGAAHGDSEAVTIFTALQELGLRLEPQRAPMEVLVVDRLDKPTGN